jgi:hypothetical protein
MWTQTHYIVCLSRHKAIMIPADNEIKDIFLCIASDGKLQCCVLRWEEWGNFHNLLIVLYVVKYLIKPLSLYNTAQEQ